MEAPSEPIETNQSLSGLEPVELAGGRDALAVQGLDLGPARPLVQEALELVQAVGVALDPDRAVGQVLRVAGEPKLAGLALHRPAEPDPLDLALDHGLQPHGLIHRGTAPESFRPTGAPLRGSPDPSSRTPPVPAG